MRFFAELKNKLKRSPDRSFDQRFWARFESEFANPLPKSSPFPYLRWAGAGTAVASLLVLATYGWVQRSARVLEEQTSTALLLEERDLVDNLELLTTFEDPELDEQDWEILLGEKSRET